MSAGAHLLVLVIETSGRPGQVALARGSTLLQGHVLDEARRHARDLAPAVAELLRGAGARPADVGAVVVSAGPGSYTGLRVGITSAKTFAHATGSALVAVGTFEAIARQAPAELDPVTVIGDAQQGHVYVQQFHRIAGGSTAASALAIVPFADWAAIASGWVTGPGLVRFGTGLPASVRLVDRSLWTPAAESVLLLGLERLARGETVQPYALEPVYLRPSAAERQWDARPARPGPPSAR